MPSSGGWNMRLLHLLHWQKGSLPLVLPVSICIEILFFQFSLRAGNGTFFAILNSFFLLRLNRYSILKHGMLISNLPCLSRGASVQGPSIRLQESEVSPPWKVTLFLQHHKPEILQRESRYFPIGPQTLQKANHQGRDHVLLSARSVFFSDVFLGTSRDGADHARTDSYKRRVIKKK